MSSSSETLLPPVYIAPSDIDKRSIEDVNLEELQDYTQCNFFAGIGS